MSLRSYPGINWHRWCWLCLRHHERAFTYYAQAGRFHLAEVSEQTAVLYRKSLGLNQ